MSHLKRLSIAGGLALAAAVFNSMYLAAQTKPAEFVAVSSDVEVGQIISESMVRSVGVPGDVERNSKSLIPYSQRNVVTGLPASRAYRAGDVVFYRDLKPPAARTRWEVIGPFRLISVNERSGDTQTSSYKSNRDSITIAVNADFEGQTQKLLELFAERPVDRKQADNTRRITAVQIVPPESFDTSSETIANEVFQTVKFDRDVQLPPVLVKGDLIRFVLKDAGQL